jgi:hypothetical protein
MIFSLTDESSSQLRVTKTKSGASPIEEAPLELSIEEQNSAPAQ